MSVRFPGLKCCSSPPLDLMLTQGSLISLLFLLDWLEIKLSTKLDFSWSWDFSYSSNKSSKTPNIWKGRDLNVIKCLLWFSGTSPVKKNNGKKPTINQNHILHTTFSPEIYPLKDLINVSNCAHIIQDTKYCKGWDVYTLTSSLLDSNAFLCFPGISHVKKTSHIPHTNIWSNTSPFGKDLNHIKLCSDMPSVERNTEECLICVCIYHKETSEAKLIPKGHIIELH